MASPHYYGDEDYDDDEDPNDIVFCAESFESFMARFWLENELWFSDCMKEPMPRGGAGYLAALRHASAPEDPYPEIGQILVRSTPKPWKRIVLEARLSDGTAQFEAKKFADGRLTGVRLDDPERLRILFERVQEITQEVGEPTTPRWQTATFVLKSDGAFDVKFGYDGSVTGGTAPSPRAATPTAKRPWWRFWGRK